MGQERELQYKVFPMELKKEPSLNEGEFIGRSAVFGNVDSWNDVIVQGAFKQTLRGKKIRALFFLHEAKYTIGIAENEADDQALITHGKYNMSVSDAVDKYHLHKQGALGDLSIGYTAINFEYEDRKGVRIRLLKEIKLYEVSILPIGYAANQKAFVTELKTKKLINDIKSMGNDELLELIESKKNDVEFINKLMALFTEPEKSTPDEKSLDINDKPTYDHLLKFNENLIKLKESIKEA